MNPSSGANMLQNGMTPVGNTTVAARLIVMRPLVRVTGEAVDQISLAAQTNPDVARDVHLDVTEHQLRVIDRSKGTVLVCCPGDYIILANSYEHTPNLFSVVIKQEGGPGLLFVFDIAKVATIEGRHCGAAALLEAIHERSGMRERVMSSQTRQRGSSVGSIGAAKPGVRRIGSTPHLKKRNSHLDHALQEMGRGPEIEAIFGTLG